jgi:hypothetical protein
MENVFVEPLYNLTDDFLDKIQELNIENKKYLTIKNP